MSDKKVYVVIGTCGEYSDREEWAVRAFLSEKRAQDEVLKLQLQVHPINRKVDNPNFYKEIPQEFKDAHQHEWPFTDLYLRQFIPLDPNFKSDYTGTKYYYLTVDLHDE